MCLLSPGWKPQCGENWLYDRFGSETEFLEYSLTIPAAALSRSGRWNPGYCGSVACSVGQSTAAWGVVQPYPRPHGAYHHVENPTKSRRCDRMGVRVRQRADRPGWWVFIDHQGKQKKKHLPDKESAQRV